MTTLELIAETPPSPVVTMLEDLLDREWVAQSDRTAPLQPTPTVRELVELAQGGIFGASIGPAASPRELVQRLSGALPETFSPWTLRALRRATTLRPPRPELPPAAVPRRLEPPEAEAPEDATVVEPEPPAQSPRIAEAAAAGETFTPAASPAAAATLAPELPPATHDLAPVHPAAEAAAASRWWLFALALLVGAALGCAATLLASSF